MTESTAGPELPTVEGTEPIIGYRAYRAYYRVGYSETDATLMGARQPWHTAERTAVCDHNMIPMVDCDALNLDHDSKHPCGIYSMKMPTAEASWGDSWPVVAEVESRGLVIEHEHGYRAERVKIRWLWYIVGDDDRVSALERCRAITRRYHVPCAPVASVWDVHREVGTYERAVGLLQVQTSNKAAKMEQEKAAWKLASQYGGTSYGSPSFPNQLANQSQLQQLQQQAMLQYQQIVQQRAYGSMSALGSQPLRIWTPPSKPKKRMSIFGILGNVIVGVCAGAAGLALVALLQSIL